MYGLTTKLGQARGSHVRKSVRLHPVAASVPLAKHELHVIHADERRSVVQAAVVAVVVVVVVVVAVVVVVRQHSRSRQVESVSQFGHWPPPFPTYTFTLVLRTARLASQLA
ncbi:unnamed protein product [Polarella glacialis]|uniref:Uncharacterized protein n=1 Tax=Polarella glacialis TaxID=89957 RepID=A0A813HU25_POLGL|nr:unnamed protein product [Polarella glacialis]